jgi:ABC-2 type transport system permease protein
MASPFGVVCAAAASAVCGVLLVIDLRGGEARLDVWFAGLFVVLAALAAVVSMRAFADEERTGSLELLLTAPVSTWEVVVGKLLAAAGVLGVVVVVSLSCPALVASMGDPDPGPMLTGYVGVVLVGFAFLAVGVAVSATTSSPLVAVGGTAAALVVLWFFGVIAGALSGLPRSVVGALSPGAHITGFLRGTLSIADAAYFLSLVAVATTTAVAVLRARR